MRAIHKRQRLCPDDIRHGHFAVKMWEQGTAARGFPFQGVPGGICVHCDQHQALNTGKMLCGRFARLLCGREMHIAIGHIYGCAIGHSIAAQGGPFIGPEYLENQHGAVMPWCASGVKGGWAVRPPYVRASRR